MEKKKRIGLLIAVCLGTFLASLDISIVNVALPAIQKDLGSDMSGLQWIINSYAICLSAFMLSVSSLSDRYGHKKMWLLGVLLFTIGSFICAVAGSMSVLILGRVVQGFSGAILIPSAMSMISYAYPNSRERVAAVGIWSALSALALILGPLLGGVLVHYLSWHSIFSINLPIGIAAFSIGLWSIDERSYKEDASLDPYGQILSIICLSLLSCGLIKMGETGSLSTVSILCIIGFIITLVLFVLVEKKVSKPILQLDLFKNKFFSGINFASFILGFSCYSSLFFFSIYLQRVQGYEPQEAGFRMMPQFFVTGVVSLFFGKLNKYFTTHALMKFGYAIAGLSMIIMSFFDSNTSYITVGSFFALLGLGMGLAVPSTGAMVMDAVGEKQFAMASATMNALRQMGMSIGIALLASLMSVVAILSMSKNLSGVVSDNILSISENAIRYNVFLDDSALIKDIYLTSMTKGFDLAMLLSGIGCFIALFVIAKVKKDS